MVLGGGTFGRCLSYEAGTFMNGIVSVIKETLQGFLVPSTMYGHSEG